MAKHREEQRELLRSQLVKAQVAVGRSADMAAHLGYERLEDDLTFLLLELGHVWGRLESGRVHRPLPGQQPLPF